MSEKNSEWTYPGDVISSPEEFLPGVNAVELNGAIVSLAAGKVMKDNNRMIIYVKTNKVRLKPKIGDTCYGQIIKLDQRQAIVKIGGYSDGKKGVISYTAEGYIRFNQNDHRQDFSSAPVIKVGDFIRGNVLRIGQNFELGVRERNLGVVKARCSTCRNFLELKSGSLYCNNCERTEARKFTEDYGNIEFLGD